jgi:hypothetical protein
MSLLKKIEKELAIVEEAIASQSNQDKEMLGGWADALVWVIGEIMNEGRE